MKKEDTIRIDMLQSLNTLNLAQDFINSLTISITDNSPNDKWKKIVKDLNGICFDINNSQTFFSRVFQELELQAELNHYIKHKNPKEVLEALKENNKLRLEIEELKKNIK